MEFKIANATLQLVKDDITNIEADAIVNAANSTLLGGGGVDGAIHAKGGPRILEECKRLRKYEWPDGLPTGNAVATTAGNLKAKKVIHTVGPIWRGGVQEEPKLLRRAYWNTLKLAANTGLKSVAFPSISTGAYNYPTEQASTVAIETIKDFLSKDEKIEKVIMVLYSQMDLDIYANTAAQILKRS